ncbi:MAG: mercury transporter [Rhodobacterales bacterium]|jgi:mercuric ion transport protein|uniref:mercuric transporter MerT family protein n=1 Tax=unclassified Seohaeicola TaxID=2641111 RepID=UPI00237B2792|nr:MULTISPECIES: mercuric transporter MerT family protein [unclassified Seohaeicola]MDD9708424.1 mercuric transporter MerT family protein [Seohaeicola sp. 4SK31]MDD9736422.1 mercuric transporter MerT family protein [Seohaeicola sp. SP36]MDX5411954.1 mercury transporter [Rhodobacterales bacterium]
MTAKAIETERQDGDRTDKTGWAATGVGLLGALAMTSCCILPLVLVSLGVTGVFIGQLTALYAYKWVTFSFAAGALGYGFWKTYCPVPAGDCGTGTCSRPVDRGVMRGLLWSALAMVLLALIFPYVAPRILTF